MPPYLLPFMLTRAGTQARFAELSDRQMETYHNKIDQFDPNEWQNDAPQSPDQQVPAQQSIGAEGPVFDSLERDWDEGWNNERVEDYSRQDG